MCGWQVKLCDPLVTHGPYLSARPLAPLLSHDKALNKSPDYLPGKWSVIAQFERAPADRSRPATENAQ